MILSTDDYTFLIGLLSVTLYKRYAAFYKINPDFFDEAIRTARTLIKDKYGSQKLSILSDKDEFNPDTINQIGLVWNDSDQKWIIKHFNDDVTEVLETKLDDSLEGKLKRLAVYYSLNFSCDNITALNDHSQFKANAVTNIVEDLQGNTIINSFNEFVNKVPNEYNETSKAYFSSIVHQSNRGMPNYENPERHKNEKYISSLMVSLKFLVYSGHCTDEKIKQFVGALVLRDHFITIYDLFIKFTNPKLQKDDLEAIANTLVSNVETISKDLNERVIPFLSGDSTAKLRQCAERLQTFIDWYHFLQDKQELSSLSGSDHLCLDKFEEMSAKYPQAKLEQMKALKVKFFEDEELDKRVEKEVDKVFQSPKSTTFDRIGLALSASKLGSSGSRLLPKKDPSPAEEQGSGAGLNKSV